MVGLETLNAHEEYGRGFVAPSCWFFMVMDLSCHRASYCKTEERMETRWCSRRKLVSSVSYGSVGLILVDSSASFDHLEICIIWRQQWPRRGEPGVGLYPLRRISPLCSFILLLDLDPFG